MHQILALKISLISTKTVLVNHTGILVVDTTLASDTHLRFRELFLEYNKNHDN